jgi:galacturan 1,4-alpha-galacturonidase
VGGLVPQDSYESGGVPRGGGWGIVRNITFRNFRLHGPNHGPNISQNSGNNGSYTGTSKMEVRDILFENWTGFLAGETRMATVSCTMVHPCSGIEVRNMSLLSWSQGIPIDNGTCEYIAPGGVIGVTGESCNTS